MKYKITIKYLKFYKFDVDADNKKNARDAGHREMISRGYSEGDYKLTDVYRRKGQHYVNISMYVRSFIDVVAENEKTAKENAVEELEKKGLYRLMYDIIEIEQYGNKLELCYSCKYFIDLDCKKNIKIKETLNEGCNFYSVK